MKNERHEFKYLPLGDNKLSGEQVRKMTHEELKAFQPVKEAFSEAEKKLTGYRETLRKVYGECLRLRAFTVIAVGFDRLVWEEFSPMIHQEGE